MAGRSSWSWSTEFRARSGFRPTGSRTVRARATAASCCAPRSPSAPARTGPVCASPWPPPTCGAARTCRSSVRSGSVADSPPPRRPAGASLRPVSPTCSPATRRPAPAAPPRPSYLPPSGSAPRPVPYRRPLSRHRPPLPRPHRRGTARPRCPGACTARPRTASAARCPLSRSRPARGGPAGRGAAAWASAGRPLPRPPRLPVGSLPRRPRRLRRRNRWPVRRSRAAPSSTTPPSCCAAPTSTSVGGAGCSPTPPPTRWRPNTAAVPRRWAGWRCPGTPCGPASRRVPSTTASTPPPAPTFRRTAPGTPSPSGRSRSVCAPSTSACPPWSRSCTRRWCSPTPPTRPCWPARWRSPSTRTSC